MKGIKAGTVAALLALLATGAGAYEAALSSSSVIWLEGDSTLHAYSSTATAVTFAFALEGDEPSAALSRKASARLTLSIPVKGLKSGGSSLDKNLWKALSADKHPNIDFALSTYTISGAGITAQGRLTIAGEERPVSLEAALAVRGGRILVEGEKALLMTDFGIKPPKMMLGAVKTADRVVVKFRLELERATGDIMTDSK